MMPGVHDYLIILLTLDCFFKKKVPETKSTDGSQFSTCSRGFWLYMATLASSMPVLPSSAKMSLLVPDFVFEIQQMFKGHAAQRNDFFMTRRLGKIVVFCG